MIDDTANYFDDDDLFEASPQAILYLDSGSSPE